MNLSHHEIKLVAEELEQVLLPARIQKVFESSPKVLVLQLRAPGQTHYLLVSVEPDDTRLHIVESKPRQPDHPSAFTMQLRKWVQGAWIESVEVSQTDRIVHLDLQAIDPDWIPEREDQKAPRTSLRLVVELLGQHPTIFLIDEGRRIIGRSQGRILGDRPSGIDERYQPPPPPPPTADDEKVREALQGKEADGTRSRALQAHFETALFERTRDDLQKSLTSRLKSRAKSLRRRVKHVEEDLSRIEDAEEYKRRGELLQSAYGKVEPGAKSAVVPDFYAEGLPDVEIPLDPAKSLQSNIDRYFHQYRRYSAAREQVEERLLESMELLEEVEDARQALRELSEPEELEEFQKDLERAGVLPSKKKQQRGGKRQKALPPYREFRGHSGETILVGRGARHNDLLTTSVARGRDMWLHARDWAGAHVVLRGHKNKEVHSEDLIDAATLAAFFSRGKDDTLVDVTYTKAKHVNKPTGAPPGLVTIAGGSTLGVRIEKDRLKRLLDSEVPQG